VYILPIKQEGKGEGKEQMGFSKPDPKARPHKKHANKITTVFSALEHG